MAGMDRCCHDDHERKYTPEEVACGKASEITDEQIGYRYVYRGYHNENEEDRFSFHRAPPAREAVPGSHGPRKARQYNVALNARATRLRTRGCGARWCVLA
jgi:hypothetical protein